MTAASLERVVSPPNTLAPAVYFFFLFFHFRHPTEIPRKRFTYPSLSTYVLLGISTFILTCS